MVSLTVDGERLALAAICVLIFAISSYCARYLYAQAACFAHAFPEARIDFAMNAYCVIRVNNTDLVLPLPAARQVFEREPGEPRKRASSI